ncbi:MAG TPA: histidine kinase dimerization/phospho-acceptor domain-containing protein, partial [Blastocatellia bacterium]|nr:histidine kinase dimerization/phospho-acceptor domain-containing protein [Blastocatellia bacterium]
MNQPASNPASPQSDQPKIVLIYTLLATGFVFLLVLIWLIGSRSTQELERIRTNAEETSDKFKERFRLVSKLREAEINILAKSKLVRATSSFPIPIVPFNKSLNEARLEFQKAFKSAEEYWSKQVQSRLDQLRKEGKSEVPPDFDVKKHRDEREWMKILKSEELVAWKMLEQATPQFLKFLENWELADDEPADASLQPTPSPDGFPKKEKEKEPVPLFEDALSTLSNAVIKEQGLILEQMEKNQRVAIQEVNRTSGSALVIGLVVVVIVVSLIRSRLAELRKAVRLAQEAKDFARSVFDSQSNDILVIDENGDLSAVNKAFYKHFNLSASELTLQDYRSALAQSPELAGFVQQTLSASDKDGSHRERIEIKPKRGLRQSRNFADESRLLDVYVSPLTIDQQTRGRVVVLVDVTEAERAREELRRSRALSTVGQITAQVAHELYNPIGAVKLNIELLEMQMSGADEDLKHTVARLKRGTEHLSTIVMDLRYLTRAREPERKPTNLNSLLEETVELAGDRLERSRTVVLRRFSDDLPLGNLDSQQLRKVFLNLLINAVEASPANS